MKKIYIIKSILANETLSDNAFCVWAALQPLSGSKMELLLSIPFLGYLIYGREPIRTEADGIRAGFDELVERGVCKVLRKLRKTEFVCDITGLFFKAGTEYFVTVEYSELHKIMNIQTKTDKGKLFRYFASVVGCFNHSSGIDEKYRDKISGISLEAINPLIPKKTAIRYNSLLEENQLLFIQRSEDVLIKENNIRRIANAYSRYADRELCIEFSSIYQSNYGWNHLMTKRKSDLDKANRNRSLGQKYNNLCKGKQYDLDTIEDIYNWANNWNRIQWELYLDDLSKGNKPELLQKDMDIFGKYGFQIEEEDEKAIA